MAFDRQSIERRDFPIARRGYDPASVDRHLSAIADAFDDLRTRSAAGGLDAGTRRLQAQLDGVHREMETLLTSLRTGAARVAERLAAVEGELPAVVPQPPTRAAVLPPDEHVAPAPVAPPQPEEEPAGVVHRTRASAPTDTEGARLVALDMALAGQPRDQVDTYLAEHFAGVDRVAVLDAVYASI
ncbi:MAG: DivIVA domain-containing protein [Solirubrobacteraceae bacterium]